MIRVDCHSHTTASWDSMLTPEMYVRDAVAAGLGATFVTDHNTLDGYWRVRDLAPPFRAIPGVEVSSADGELLALFVDEVPPAGRPAEHVVEFVHERGGLVVIPHPFAVTALQRIRPARLWEIAPLVDAIEGSNARSERVRADEQARELATRVGKPLTAGSDAHLPAHLGHAHVVMPEFTDARDFLARLSEAQVVMRRRATFAGNIWGVARSFFATGNLPPEVTFWRRKG